METLSHKKRQQRRKDMASFVKGGKTVQAAAQRFSVTTTTVESACRENGVPFNRFSSGSHDTVLRVVAKLIAGKGTAASIAREVYATREYVGQVVQRCIRWDVPIHKRYK